MKDVVYDWGTRIRECLVGTTPSHATEGWLLPGLSALPDRS